MVSFDAAIDGTLAREWRADSRFGDGSFLDLSRLASSGVRRVVVIAPHPDDETLGAGGLIAEAASLGLDVLVVVVTDGAASHPGLPGLADARRGELLRAVDILAPGASVSFIGAPDGRVLEERDGVRAALAKILDRLGTESLVVVPWTGDGHRDHRVVGELCAELASGRTFRVLEYPIWMWHWGSPSDPAIPWDRFTPLQLGEDALGRKRRAIQQFESQLGGILRDSFVQHFLDDTETFMTVEPPRLVGSYFDDLYERHDDPWKFESRWYEKRKRAVTLAALPEERYDNALELGCSIGTTTELLAERCDSVLAVDISQSAVDRARARLVQQPHVEFRQADVAAEFPAGSRDLIVMSEVGYYFDRATLDRVLAGILDRLGDEGTLLACHWLHPVADYPLSGEVVHEAIRLLPGLSRIALHREDDFILEVFSRDPRSVAEREGLLS